jgi:NUMOD1 domain
LNKRKTAAGFIWKYIEDENIDYNEKITINPNIGRKVCQYDLDMNLICIHNSIADAARKVNIHKNNIWAVIHNFRKTSGGFIWKYLDE